MAIQSRLKNYLSVKKDQVTSVLLLFFASITSFGIFNSNVISSDDWSYFVAQYVFGELHPINWTDRRPFILILYYGLAKLFGLRLEFYYLFNFIILFLSALLIYIIVKRVFPGQTWFAGLTSLIYLVYPVDYTRTWLIMLYIRFWWLVSLCVIWLIIEFLESGSKWKYALAMIGIAFPLGAYEGQLGVIVLACILIPFLLPKNQIKRMLALWAGVFLIGLSFLFWRTYIQPTFLGIKDIYVDSFQFNPGVVLERYFLGANIFVFGWLEPIRAQLEFSGVNYLALATIYLFVILTVYLWGTFRTSRLLKLQPTQKLTLAKPYIFVFLTGIAFWFAGYIPIIGLYSPALKDYTSRVNSFAIAGAALAVVATSAIISCIFSSSILQMRVLTAFLILPIFFAGIFVQQQINSERQIAWDTQKAIWEGVFKTVPNIKDGNNLMIIIPDYEQLRPFQLLPFVSDWEIDAATQVLNNNQGIGGFFYYTGGQSADLVFNEDGFQPYPTNQPVPYSKLVLVSYDQESETVELVSKIEKELSLPFTVEGYDPYPLILEAGPAATINRWLVK